MCFEGWGMGSGIPSPAQSIKRYSGASWVPQRTTFDILTLTDRTLLLKTKVEYFNCTDMLNKLLLKISKVSISDPVIAPPPRPQTRPWPCQLFFWLLQIMLTYSLEQYFVRRSRKCQASRHLAYDNRTRDEPSVQSSNYSWCVWRVVGTREERGDLAATTCQQWCGWCEESS